MDKDKSWSHRATRCCDILSDEFVETQIKECVEFARALTWLTITVSVTCVSGIRFTVLLILPRVDLMTEWVRLLFCCLHSNELLNYIFVCFNQ